MGVYSVADDVGDRGVEVLAGGEKRLELIRDFFELVGDDGVERDVRTRDGVRRAEASELELVAGEGERRGAVAVGGVLRKLRKNVDADLHI